MRLLSLSMVFVRSAEWLNLSSAPEEVMSCATHQVPQAPHKRLIVLFSAADSTPALVGELAACRFELDACSAGVDKALQLTMPKRVSNALIIFG